MASRSSRAALVLLLLAGSAPARAEDSKSRAHALYESAMAHYNLSEFKEALADFKEGYRLHHDPVFLFDIAQCQRQLGDSAAAATFYRAYRRESQEADHAQVDRLIESMDRAVAEQQKHQRATEVMRPSEPSSTPVDLTAPPSSVGTATTTALTHARPQPRPLVRRAWFWGAVAGGAALVAAAVIVGVMAAPPGSPSPSSGRVPGN